MFCQKCNLHYPDHLSFCRRCGQPLARSTSDHAVDSHCCTRCGARVVRGENFCQQCGNRTGVALQDTVIGACYHCGTSWRSGWHFCKNCGLDRKRALLLSTSSPNSTLLPSALPGAMKPGAVETFEIAGEPSKTTCQFCGAEAKPFSRFCESCGRRLDGADAGKKSTPVAPASSTEIDRPSAKFHPPDIQVASAPTLFEPPPHESERTATSGRVAGNGFAAEVTEAPNQAAISSDLSVSGDLSNAASTPSENLPLAKAQLAADEPVIVSNPSAAKTGRPSAPETVVTPLPPFGRVPDIDDGPVTFKDIWARNQRAIVQSAALLLLAAALVAAVIWWISRARQKDTGGSVTARPAQTLPQTQVAPRTAPNAGVNQLNVPVPEGMVYVPGGQFEMGRSDGDEYERPAHPVTVEPFFMDRTEVSNEQYQRFVTETNHRAPTHWPNGQLAPAEAKLPVVNVSWDDANAYAKWAGNRLPTEAEWEFAARGTDGRLYPWGNTWNSAASNAGHGNNGRPMDVGHFPAGVSPYGAMDMCGNVWEWTSSSLQSYAEGHQEIAPGKVIRGGAFDVPSDRATATYRGVLPADRLRDKTGFRTVRPVK